MESILNTLSNLQYMPWLIAAALLIPMVVAAAVWKVFPTVAWLIPMSIILVSTLSILLFSNAVYLILGIDLVVVILLVIDMVSLAGASGITVRRTMGRAASLKNEHPVTLQIDNQRRRTLRLDIRDDLPLDMTAQPDTFKTTLNGRARIEFTYSLKAKRRGAFELERVFFRRYSLGRFWVRYITKELKSTLHVYPDMKQLAKYALLARTNRLSLIGVRRTRKLGQDNNFERLRDYSQDDNYRHIDWRATAKRQKLTVKQFQADQSQRIMFMLDCGRMMTNEHNGMSLVDYALNSILMLSYVALSQGDSVGLVCFSDKVHDFVPMRGGPGQMNHLLHAGFDRFPRLVQSRFDEAFLHLSTNCRRRSMVVLITNVIDEVSAAQITGYLQNLSGRHLPVLALLRDHRMFDFANNVSPDPEVLYRSAAAAQILTWRHDVLKRLEKSGSIVVDAFPDELTSPLVNKYLEVKAKHVL
jgi:uncharacterized protein (DUF58 family)